MERTRDNDSVATPLFSVIIPLEFHRGRWEKCLQAWQAQSLANSKYELVLVTPSNFADRVGLDAAMAQPGPICRLVVSDRRHDMGLCADGVARARGQFLFFTESHCWPEPDVLMLCLQALDEHSDWAGLSCRSQRVASNRMAFAEAEMYGADIAHGMTLHPWRKILDQCFVTRREAYTQSGGFDPTLGHFAEWVLAASYHELGLSIGYLPEARFHHQYTGQLAELRQFTRDFLRGEVRYLTESTNGPGWHLIEKPADWIKQGNLDRQLARQLLKQELQSARRTGGSSPRSHLQKAMRWFFPAAVGDRLSRLKAAVAEIVGYVRVRFANCFGSSRKLNDTFRNYFARVIDRQRLSLIAEARKANHQELAGLVQCDIFAPHHAGLYSIEQTAGTLFRWSEPAAIVRINLLAGPNTIRVRCAPVFALPTIKELRFHLNGQPVPDSDIVFETFQAIIKTRVATAGLGTLSWTCSRLAAADDPRKLGLPIAKIELVDAS